LAIGLNLSQTTRRAKLPDKLLFAIASATFGLIDAVLLIGWRQLDPANLAWLKVDPALYQTGWEFLRWEPWHFPPTWLDRLDFPFGVSAAYLDVIPVIAVPLKLLSPFLPENFQYFGLYALLCLVLQAFFALRLMARFTADRILVLLGALFFLDSPILLMRLLGHFSLCSQWLIIAGLYCYFRPIETLGVARYLRPFALLLAISAGVSPYLSMMLLGIAAAAVARVWWGRNELKSFVSPSTSMSNVHNRLRTRRMMSSVLDKPFAWFGIFLLSLLLPFWFFGFLVVGSPPEISGAGYGAFSMNLVAPFNPNGAALLFKSFPVFSLQGFEGYNYLGAGVILLGIVFLARNPSSVTKLWSPSLKPLVIMSIVFVLLAVSARVTIGQAVVATIPLPNALVGTLAVFRSSGRFFWPVYELLTLSALVGTLTSVPKRWPARATIAAALLVQYFDTLPIRDTVAHESARMASSPLIAAEWQALARSHAHLVLVPAVQCDPRHTPGGDAAWPWFSRLAARSAMTLNSVHAARSSTRSNVYNCTTLPQEIRQGKLDRGTAYILSDQLARLSMARNPSSLCRRVDGFNLCMAAGGR
jgi:hypothetical protein